MKPNEKPVVTLVASNKTGNIVVTGVANSVVRTPGGTYPCSGKDTLTVTDPIIHGAGASVEGVVVDGSLTLTNSNGTSKSIPFKGMVDYIATNDSYISSVNTDLMTPVAEMCKLALEPVEPPIVIGYVNTFVFPDGAYAVITEKDGLAVDCTWVGCEPRYDTICSATFCQLYDDGNVGRCGYVQSTFIQYIDSRVEEDECCGKPETCENMTCYMEGACCDDENDYEEPDCDVQQLVDVMKCEVARYRNELEKLVNCLDENVVDYMKDKVGQDLDFDQVSEVVNKLQDAKDVLYSERE